MILALLLAPAFASAQGKGPIQAAEAACGPADARLKANFNNETGDVKPAPDGKALVYVVNPMFSRWPYIEIGVDGRWVGLLRGSSHLATVLGPGRHHVCARFKVRPLALRRSTAVYLIDINAEEGGTSYLFVRPWCADADLESCAFPVVVIREMNPDAGRLYVVSTRRSELKDQP